jgi:hypothetical protein
MSASVGRFSSCGAGGVGAASVRGFDGDVYLYVSASGWRSQHSAGRSSL